MKKILLLSILFLITSLITARPVVVTVSEPDAEIFVNGAKVGYSPQTININNKECFDVEVRKAGYIT